MGNHHVVNIAQRIASIPCTVGKFQTECPFDLYREINGVIVKQAE